MALHDALCVVAIAPNTWGKGKDIKAAEKELKAAGHSDANVRNKTGLRRVYFFLDCEPAKVGVSSIDGSITYPKNTTAMRVEEHW